MSAAADGHSSLLTRLLIGSNIKYKNISDIPLKCGTNPNDLVSEPSINVPEY